MMRMAMRKPQQGRHTPIAQPRVTSPGIDAIQKIRTRQDLFPDRPSPEQSLPVNPLAPGSSWKEGDYGMSTPDGGSEAWDEDDWGDGGSSPDEWPDAEFNEVSGFFTQTLWALVEVAVQELKLRAMEQRVSPSIDDFRAIYAQAYTTALDDTIARFFPGQPPELVEQWINEMGAPTVEPDQLWLGVVQALTMDYIADLYAYEEQSVADGSDRDLDKPDPPDLEGPGGGDKRMSAVTKIFIGASALVLVGGGVYLMARK